MEGVSLFGGAALSTVFSIAAIAKIGNVEEFRTALESFGRIRRSLAPSLSVLVPVIELGLALSLWFVDLRRAAAVILVALLAGFTALLGDSLAHGSDASCGCFGTATTQRVSVSSVVRNVALLAIGLGVALLPATNGSDELATSIGGIGVGLIVVTVDQTWSVLRPNWIRADQARRGGGLI